MSFSNVIMAIFVLYFIYYAFCILYDSLIKSSVPVSQDDKDVAFFVNEEYNKPKDVLEDKPLVIHNTSTLSQSNNNTLIANPTISNPIASSVEMHVEGQAIPFEMLMKSGKSIFAGVSF